MEAEFVFETFGGIIQRVQQCKKSNDQDAS